VVQELAGSDTVRAMALAVRVEKERFKFNCAHFVAFKVSHADASASRGQALRFSSSEGTARANRS